MQINLNLTRDQRISQFIQDKIIEGKTAPEINKLLKHEFHVKLKGDPTSKYQRHTGAKQKAKAMQKMLASGQVVNQTGTTAAVSVSYTPPEESKE